MKKKIFVLAAVVAMFAAAIYLGSRRGGGGGEIHRVEWPTMGTIAAYQCRNEVDLGKAHEVKAVFEEIERLLNAHDKESELSRLAALSNDEILEKCSPLVKPCYEAAFEFERLSGGAFSPRWKGALTLDLGAIAKGFAVDVAAARVGQVDALIDLGGNLKALGGEWRIAVEGGGETFTLKKGEACATSGEYHRGKHIKDARTGQDATGEVFSVSVITLDSAMVADALSTILFIFGREKGEEFIRENFPGAATIWVEKGATSSTAIQYRAE